MKVLKFGGRSVGTRQGLEQAAELVARELPRGGLVVVSAISGATDLILRSVSASASGDPDAAQAARTALEARHRAVAQALGLEEALRPYWEPLFQSLAGLLEGIGLLWEASPRSRDAALAVGETLAARLLAALLQRRGLDATFRDAREVMRTDARHGRARPDLDAIRDAAARWRERIAAGALWVTQGFLGVAPDGSTTTLGRGGADISAALLGEALGAEEVQIWTGVDGVLTADPSLVPQARPIAEMSLREAAALSSFGAKVIHADAFAPVRRSGFRLTVANLNHPEAGGTVIRAEAPARLPGSITSVAYKEGVSCLRLPPAEDFGPLFEASARLQEAGATLYGLLATPDGGLLVARAETPESEAVLAGLAEAGMSLQRGWAVVALVGEGLRGEPGMALDVLGPLVEEPVAAFLAGDTGVSLAFLVPDHRLSRLIPRLHEHCIEAASSR